MPGVAASASSGDDDRLALLDARRRSTRIEPSLRERLLGGDLLVVSKTNRFSTVHRRAKMDDITVKRVDAQGDTVALHRLLGLFTSQGVHGAGEQDPILARKLRQIVVAEDFLEGSHDYKTLVELFESFPKDELFSAAPTSCGRRSSG